MQVPIWSLHFFTIMFFVIALTVQGSCTNGWLFLNRAIVGSLIFLPICSESTCLKNSILVQIIGFAFQLQPSSLHDSVLIKIVAFGHPYR